MNGWLALAFLGVLAAGYGAARLIAARQTLDAILAEDKQQREDARDG